MKFEKITSLLPSHERPLSSTAERVTHDRASRQTLQYIGRTCWNGDHTCCKTFGHIRFSSGFVDVSTAAVLSSWNRLNKRNSSLLCDKTRAPDI